MASAAEIFQKMKNRMRTMSRMKITRQMTNKRMIDSSDVIR